MNEYTATLYQKFDDYFLNHPLNENFLETFFGALIEVFGFQIIVPDVDYDAEYDVTENRLQTVHEDYSWLDQIDYTLTRLGGTSGWFKAFEDTCTKVEDVGLLEYYKTLEWHESDIFDGYIADKIILKIKQTIDY